MNKNQAKNFLDVIRAFNDGKQIQVKVGDEWKDVNEWHFCEELRIKPIKPEEEHYRPFEDTAELMLHYAKHFNYECENYCEPIIWVKDKLDNRFLITGFSEKCICIEREWVLMSTLFEKFVFLDGSVCGVEE